MPISFNDVPSNLRVPFVAVEIDNSNASQGPALLVYRALAIGQRLSGGTWLANTLHTATSADQVATGTGRGSQLHRMAKRWFKINKFTPFTCGVLDDDGAAAAATGKLTFTGPATATGTLALRVGGEPVNVAVANGDTAATIAANVAAALPATSDLALSGVQGGVGHTTEVNLTAKNKGLSGNEIDVRVNYQDGEALPLGVGVTVTAMSGGTTNPALTTLIAAMRDIWFNVVAFPYTDATSLTAIEAELHDRFGSMRMIDGFAFTAKNDSIANLATLGNGRNSPHVSILGTNNSPVPPAEYAAAVAARVALAAQADPGRPFQTLTLDGILPPIEADQWTLEERNTLLFDGISTTKVAAGGVVQIERLISTYKTNAAGVADESYLDATTLFNLMYLRYSFRTRIQQKYARHKLANDGTKIGPGQAVITPKGGKAEAVLWFNQMEQLGLVENSAQFKRDLVVERNAQNPNRLDFLLPPDLINQFIVGAVNLQFIL
jgi:phage tail sheath gpL-like